MTTADVTHYELLGVSRNASTQEIHEAYRYFARLVHPDQSPAGAVDPTAMAALNNAWFVLRDDDRRAAYDRRLDIPDACEPLLTPTCAPPERLSEDTALGVGRMRNLRRLVVVALALVCVAAVVLTIIGIVGAGNRP